MITINSGSVVVQVDGAAQLLVDDEIITLDDGSTVTLASNTALPAFQHAETDDHELIWHEALAALGLDVSAQPQDREIELHVVGAPDRLYRAHRRWEEGWGIGTEAVLGGPSVAPAGTYLITALTSRVFG